MRFSRIAYFASGPGRERLIEEFSRFRINPQRLRDVAEFGAVADRGTHIASCSFIHQEGAIRLAHLIRELRTLPDIYLNEPVIQKVHDWYTTSFDELVAVTPPGPDAGPAQEDDFARTVLSTVKSITDRHKPTVMTMAVAMTRLLRRGAIVDPAGTIEFLDRLFMSRIGVRFILQQHMSLFGEHTEIVDENQTTTGSRWVGAIDRETNVVAIAEHAAEAARTLCYKNLFDTPEINIRIVGLDDPFTYIPSHLYHIFFELLKNSCRAVTECHSESTEPLPPVDVLIVRGDEDLSIRVSDLGGGMPRSVQDANLFTYMYSTASQPDFFERAVEGDESALTDMNNAPLAGFGYGLPLSRLYARYLGGELTLESLEGYGTDAYVHLPGRAEFATEVLPSAVASQLSYTAQLHKALPPHWLDARPEQTSGTASAKRRRRRHLKNWR